MNKFTHQIGLLLSAFLLLSQHSFAQSIPAAQWARVGSTLVIMADGNIATGLNGITKYSLTGDRIWSVGPLKGGNYIGGQLPGTDYESIRRITAATATANGGVTVAGPLNVRQSLNVPVQISANGQSGSWSDSDLFSSRSAGDFPRDIVSTADGGFLILHSITYSDAPSSAVVRKYNSGKQLVWTKEIAYPNSASPDISVTKGNKLISTPDGGYLITGQFHSPGDSYRAWVAKLDGDGNVAWQKLVSIPLPAGSLGQYDASTMNDITDAIVSNDGIGYALVGTGRGKIYDLSYALVEIDFNGNVKQGRAKIIDQQYTFNSYITIYTGSNGKIYYAVGIGSLQSQTNPQILLVDPSTLTTVAKRTFPGPGPSVITDIATAGDGSLVFVTDNNQLVKLQPEATTPPQPPVGALTLTAPTYNCSTGAFTFNTTGGNGSTIEYMAPGITGWTTNPNQFVDQGSRTALDVQPFTLTARQNGVTVTYIWDLRAYCNGTPPPPPVNPPTGGPLALTAPTYNCTTGAFTFNTSGGNGSTIEYMAPGITGWTTNPNQFVDQGSRTANDVQPFTLSARQNGVTVTYVWNLKAACGRARLGALPEAGTGLQVRVLGNPVLNQTAEVDITGAERQAVQLNLVDSQGRVLHQQRIEQAEAVQRVRVPVGAGSGVLLLNVSTSTQRQQVKLVKP
jgi:hypothetical protein